MAVATLNCFVMDYLIPLWTIVHMVILPLFVVVPTSTPMLRGSADFDAQIHGFPDVNSEVASADFDAPFVAHAVSANFDAPRSGISYSNARLASGHFDAGHHTRHVPYSGAHVASADFDDSSCWLSSSGTSAVSGRLDARIYDHS
jgi:hypothetical protein